MTAGAIPVYQGQRLLLRLSTHTGQIAIILNFYATIVRGVPKYTGTIPSHSALLYGAESRVFGPRLRRRSVLQYVLVLGTVTDERYRSMEEGIYT